MDNFKQYRKIRARLEFVSIMIGFIVGNTISSYLGLTGKNFFTLANALNLTIVVGLVTILNIIAIKIADNWYHKNISK